MRERPHLPNMVERGRTWTNMGGNIHPTWASVEVAWVSFVGIVGTRVIHLHVTCPHTGPCGHQPVCYELRSPTYAH